MRTFLISLFSILQTGAVSLQAQTKTMVIIGSSTSACYTFTNLNIFECYVNRLQTYYNKVTPQDTSIISIAVPGQTCFNGMPSSYQSPYTTADLIPNPASNITAALNYTPKPDVVLVNFPTNAYDILSVPEVMFCLRTIRDSANAAGVACYITTSQPRTDAAFNNSIVKRKLADIKDSVLQEFGNFAIDFYTNLTNFTDSSIIAAYAYGDGIHFNGAGHQVLFNTVMGKQVFSVAAALPANFLNYNAIWQQDKSVLISWTSSKEVAVDKYEVQRSSDGIHFLSIDAIKALNGLDINKYSLSDKLPLSGWNYYKIALVNKDGKKEFTPIFKAFNKSENLSILKTLNQSAQIIIQLQSNLNQQVDIQLFNSNGSLVRRESKNIAAGTVNVFVNTDNLTNGVYYVKLQAATSSGKVVPFLKN